MVPVVLALLFASIAFWLGAALLPAPVAPEPVNPPPLDIICRVPWNNKELTQIELDAELQQHARYLATIPAPTAERTGPYRSVLTRIPERVAADTATPLPPSQNGEPVPVPDVGRADLCGARIKGLTFRGADLRYSRLMGARIELSDLSGVNLSWAYLERAGLSENHASSAVPRPGRAYNADFRGALLYDNDFAGWYFADSDMRFVDAARNDMSNATLDGVSLAGSTLRDMNMKNSNLSRAKFGHNLLSIKPGDLPLLATLRDAEGLTSLHRNTDTLSTLWQMREGLRQAGLPASAAEVGYAAQALPHRDSGQDLSSKQYFEDEAKAIFLGLPYGYGLRPERAFLIGGLMIPLFSSLYIYSLFEAARGRTKGIWLKFRPIDDNAAKLYTPVLLSNRNANPYLIGIWFSILSAFRIGWRDISVGEWIARLQTADYSFHSDGWVRTVSGLQSLLSVYLLTLVVASYLSR